MPPGEHAILHLCSTATMRAASSFPVIRNEAITGKSSSATWFTDIGQTAESNNERPPN
eukprot:CAMPEP_0203910832 /NCGR_PEP_ID=MMETSP0359-20131031/52059_1 /ASSEMBLY_ACC=CAM_ASM_000338 /TAXON_ID=268821 /ORGANISM="Scrippsiella Hangoei, Strain SHTV-5" /LENGTH=57 /DNA_ID=CAMNT_0050836391 /DNA_START=17 /DNA_END=190 /DNA_ORIENTATION=-